MCSFTQTTSVSSEAWVLSYLNVGGFRKKQKTKKQKQKGKNKNKKEKNKKTKNKKRWAVALFFLLHMFLIKIEIKN